jgi:hypothetical protein
VSDNIYRSDDWEVAPELWLRSMVADEWGALDLTLKTKWGERQGQHLFFNGNRVHFIDF